MLQEPDKPFRIDFVAKREKNRQQFECFIYKKVQVNKVGLRRCDMSHTEDRFLYSSQAMISRGKSCRNLRTGLNVTNI